MRGRGLVCAALLSVSCLRLDPNHCANQDGDFSCQQSGHGEFCSTCAGSNFGCVDERPQDACHVAGPSLESSGSGSDSGSGSGSGSGSESSSGAAPTCMLEGAVDPSCPEAQPYCIDGVCGTCDSAGPEFCGELDQATPACHAQWGRCVECIDATTCGGATAWCGNDFSCGGCFEHTHCPDSACDLERGECMDSDAVLHVSNEVCPENGAGIEAAPYCSIAVALQQIGMGERGTVIVHGTGSAYDEGLLLDENGPRTIAVLGVDDPSIVAPGTGWAALASTDMDLYVSRVGLSSAAGSGVACEGSGARLWLDDLTVADNVDGVVIDLCKARLRRVLVLESDGDGIAVSNSGELRLESSVVANGGAADGASTALRVDGKASTIDVRYTTFANNLSKLSGASVYCVAGGNGTIRNSVVLAPMLSSNDCPWAEVSFSVHDNVELAMGHDNVGVDVFDETWWQKLDASDFHVSEPNKSIFRDRARWELGDPILDYDGAPRPAYPGAMGFAGADEP